MRELQSGYAIRGMLIGSVFFFPIHFVALALPKERRRKLIGYTVSLMAVLLMAFYWFAFAAATASV